MTGMKVGCPRCRRVMLLNAADAGRALKCPSCAALFRLAGPRPAGTNAETPRTLLAPLICAGVVGLLLLGAVVGYNHISSRHDATPSPVAAETCPQPYEAQEDAVKSKTPRSSVVVETKSSVGELGLKPPLRLLGDPAAARREAPVEKLVHASDGEESKDREAPPLAVADSNDTPQPVVHVQLKGAPTGPAIAVAEKAPEIPVATESKAVKDAIAKGTAYLRKHQHANGSWGSNSYLVGYTSMPALALLESGASPKDPAVQKAAAFVRGYVPKLTATYELGLAILFLDRLGESRDKPLIQAMALRLVAGQNHVGGWTYHCPLLTQPEERELITFLKRNQPRPPLNPLGPVLPPYLVPVTDPHPQPDRPNPIATSKAPLPNPLGKDNDSGRLNPLAKTSDGPLANPLQGKKEDLHNPLVKSSTTTEAKPSAEKSLICPFKEEKIPPLIGAAKSADAADIGAVKGIAKSNGVAKPLVEKPKAAAILPKSALKRKEDMPEDTPRANLIARWPSVPDFVARLKNPNRVPAKPDPKAKGKGKAKKGGSHSDDNSNSQFAILGLWAARRHGVPMTLTLTRLDERYRSSQAATGGWEYRYMGTSQTPAMTCVGLLGLGLSHGAFHEAMNPDAAKNADPRVRQLHADPAIQRGLQALGSYIGVSAAARRANAPPPAMQNLYFLWSVERVAVLYNLRTLGNKDWYAWGSEVLTVHQAADGSWLGGGYPGSNHTIDTCMALLFLRRSNLTRDLSNNLPPYLLVRDPGR